MTHVSAYGARKVEAVSSLGYTGPVSSEVATATGLPVSLATVTSRLRLPFTDEDADVQSMTESAVQEIEHLTGRRLMPQTVRYWYDAPPAGLTIALPEPFRGIDSVTTYDTSDVAAVLSASSYRTDTRRARIVIKDTVTGWPPDDLREVDALAIEADVGYATAAAIPPDLIEAVLLRVMVTYLRDAVTPAERAGYERAIAAKVAPHRWRMGVA